MTPAEDGQHLARTLVLNMLRGIDAPSLDLIETNAQLVATMLRARDESVEVDLQALIREVESLTNVWVGTSSSLDDPSDHIPWLADRRDAVSWRFWDRYRAYLEDVEQWAPRSVRRLDEVTDDVLGRLEEPNRAGPWDRRGMIVGQVQSGKTSNYIGLVCKAADAGYRLIVVLAGMHNSLRSQTQLRLDLGFLGFDTQQERFFDRSNRRMGVGILPGRRLYPVHSLTNSEETGDFKLAVARRASMIIGSDPILLVVKKNASILRNLHSWATLIQQERHPESGRLIVPDVPILVIDDEADHGSVNTRDVQYDEDGKADPELDPTTINGLIRKLLHGFDKSAYVGLTATPFANIFIYQGGRSEDHGEDLFPRSFIVRIPAPANYMGPNEVFGVEADPLLGLEGKPGLPIVYEVEDHQMWMPDGHRKVHVVGPMPDSVRLAIRGFILACAARMARGQIEVHNSMLIHVTRFTAVQGQVAEQVRDELASLRKRLKYGDGRSTSQLVEELADQWDSDFVPTSRAFPAADIQPVSWDEVRACLSQAAARIEVMTINGTARDALAYFERPGGLSVIAIGGDKLSRGLTLEGLSVSYYLRAARMYDTLMQMGRWFGYRPGYGDLCRLYTTRELKSWYRDITSSNQELLNLLDQMAAVGGTPEDFGLRVRTHPDGLLITARAKMRHGRTMQLSFSDTISETIVLHGDSTTVESNFRLVDGLAAQLGGGAARHPPADSGNVVWSDVDASVVVAFLESVITHPDARKAQGSLLAKYVRSRVAHGELVDWTVALISNTATAVRRDIGGWEVGLTSRENQPDHGGRYVIRRLVSPADEALDLDAPSYAAALERTRREWAIDPGRSRRKEPPTIPSGPAIRRTRPARRGLLLLYPLDPSTTDLDLAVPPVGFAVSFPKSPTSATIEYVVTNTYWEQERGAG